MVGEDDSPPVMLEGFPVVLFSMSVPSGNVPPFAMNGNSYGIQKDEAYLDVTNIDQIIYISLCGEANKTKNYLMGYKRLSQEVLTNGRCEIAASQRPLEIGGMKLSAKFTKQPEWQLFGERILSIVEALLPAFILYARQKLPLKGSLAARILSKRAIEFDRVTAQVLAKIFPEWLSFVNFEGDGGGEDYGLLLHNDYKIHVNSIRSEMEERVEGKNPYMQHLLAIFAATLEVYSCCGDLDVPPLLGAGCKTEKASSLLLPPIRATISSNVSDRQPSTEPYQGVYKTLDAGEELVVAKDMAGEIELKEDVPYGNQPQRDMLRMDAKECVKQQLKADKLKLFLTDIKLKTEYSNQLVMVKEFVEQKGQFFPMDSAIIPIEISQLLQSLGIVSLYSHQKEAVEAVAKGQNVMISTPTGSGKSLCFLIPILKELISNKSSRILLLYPTKALAHDQLNAIRNVLTKLNLESVVDCYDGDTPFNMRKVIRQSCQVMLINPDILHYSILPLHKREKWGETILRNLKMVVLDESHVYSGIFGSNVSLILRRLRRLCSYYGASPQFILSSATIANPLDHASILTGEKAFYLVDTSGSPEGFKYFAVWNTASSANTTERPTRTHISSTGSSEDQLNAINRSRKRKRKHSEDLQAAISSSNFGDSTGDATLPSELAGSTDRYSCYHEAAFLVKELVCLRVRTLIFVKYRMEAEEILQQSQLHLPYEEWDKVATYRGGYSAKERRLLEAKLRSGAILGEGQLIGVHDMNHSDTPSLMPLL